MTPPTATFAQVLGGEGGGAASSRPFAVPQAVQTPATVRKPPPPSSRAAGLDGPSPMLSWGVNLRDASAGEQLEVRWLAGGWGSQHVMLTYFRQKWSSLSCRFPRK